MKSLIDVLKENKIEVRPSSGGRSVAHCPFHRGDDTPSFTIYPETGTYYCFGCGEWGDSIKFLVDYKDISYIEARDYIGAPVTQQPKKRGVIKTKYMSDTWKLIYKVANDYHTFLLDSRFGAIDYLYSRGLTLDTIKEFMLGYTDGFVLKNYSIYEYQLGVDAGIFDKDGNEIMSHRITIPNLIPATLMADFLVGRTVINNSIKYLGTRLPKPILGLWSVAKSPVIMIVEGQFDWLTLRKWGYPAIALGGTRITNHNLGTLKERYNIIVPDYDPDGQGQAAAAALKEKLGNRAYILDYSSLRNGNEKLDISVLATRPEAMVEFGKLVKEQMPWIGNLSDRTIQTFFRGLMNTTSFQSTWKPQV